MDDSTEGSVLYHFQLMATLCISMSSTISIWSKGQRPHLTLQEKELSFFCGSLFNSCYTALARDALQKRQLLWKIRPKHHYWVHLLDYMYKSAINPMATSNFLDEDMMKAMRGVSKACHPKTVKVAWARRYLLKKILSWSRSVEKKSGQSPQHFCTAILRFCGQQFCFDRSTCINDLRIFGNIQYIHIYACKHLTIQKYTQNKMGLSNKLV